MSKNILTPTELFDYRLAALLGYADPEVMRAGMPHRVYLGWQRYWESEPWGPWRDNVHAALVTRELRAMRLGPKRTAPPLSSFMVRDPRERLSEAETKVMNVLKLLGKPTTAKESAARLRKARKARNDSNGRRRRVR